MIKKITKVLALALVLVLTLTACGKPKTTAEGLYLGNKLFLEEINVKGKKETQLTIVNTPEGTKLEPGSVYKYEYEEITTSLPPQASTDKVEAVKDKDLTKISKETAEEILQYVGNAKAIYTEVEYKLDNSIEATEENLKDLEKEIVLIAYGKNADQLVKTLRDKGFKVVLELAK